MNVASIEVDDTVGTSNISESTDFFLVLSFILLGIRFEDEGIPMEVLLMESVGHYWMTDRGCSPYPPQPVKACCVTREA